MSKTTGTRIGVCVILVAGIAIGYLASSGGFDAAESADAQDVDAAQPNATSRPVIQVAQAQGVTRARKSDTQNDPSLTPWNDPNDPYVIRLNRDDKSVDAWNERNSKGNPKRDPGPIDLQRYAAGFDYVGFPTFFKAPVALTTADLKAGDVDVAIVGSTTDGNLIKGTILGTNMLRGFWTPIFAISFFIFLKSSIYSGFGFPVFILNNS